MKARFVTRHSSFVIRHLQDFGEYLLEIIEALLADDPARRQESALGKALPAARPVFQNNGVGFAVKSNDVISRNESRSAATDFRILMLQERLHQVQQCNGCTRGSVLFRPVVLLVKKRIVLWKLCDRL